jgi:hypothetical protein
VSPRRVKWTKNSVWLLTQISISPQHFHRTDIFKLSMIET